MAEAPSTSKLAVASATGSVKWSYGRIDKHLCEGVGSGPCPFKLWIRHANKRCKWCRPEYNKWFKKAHPRKKKKKKPAASQRAMLLAEFAKSLHIRLPDGHVAGTARASRKNQRP